MDMSFMPDPTFYPSSGMAMQAAPERIAYAALLNVGKIGKRDAVGVINVDPRSSAYGQFVGQVDFPNDDNELHHFGWNACSVGHKARTPSLKPRLGNLWVTGGLRAEVD
jgi:methanethiol oxidase